MNKTRPKLRVIEGGKKPLPLWMRFPPTVAAASPFNPAEPAIYRVATGDAIKAGRAGRRQLVFNLWSMVFGEPPPVPNVETYNGPVREGLACLAQAHACFQGIKRPLDTDNDGRSMLAYVVRPRMHYVLQSDMACMAKKQKVPKDVVLVIYVRLDAPSGNGLEPVGGIVTHWQFVEAEPTIANDGHAEMLPRGFEERYDKRLW